MAARAQLRELSLFSGAGGGLLASQWLKGWRTVCYVEKNPYCLRVLQARIREGYLDDAPIWDDVETFDGTPWRGLVDVVSAGFPCQPFSCAGKRRGKKDIRNGWPHTIRVIREVRPPFVFLENVTGLLAGSHGYFGQVLGELAEAGYDAKWCVLGACDVGAPHYRKRLWVVATNTQQVGREGPEPRPKIDIAIVEKFGDGRGKSDASDANDQSKYARPVDAKMAAPQEPFSNTPGERGERFSERTQAHHTVTRSAREYVTDPNSVPIRVQSIALAGREKTPFTWWSTDGEIESKVGRVVDGMAARLDQLRAIGNGQVPRVAADVWEILT